MSVRVTKVGFSNDIFHANLHFVHWNPIPLPSLYRYSITLYYQCKISSSWKNRFNFFNVRLFFTCVKFMYFFLITPFWIHQQSFFLWSTVFPVVVENFNCCLNNDSLSSAITHLTVYFDMPVTSLVASTILLNNLHKTFCSFKWLAILYMVPKLGHTVDFRRTIWFWHRIHLTKQVTFEINFDQDYNKLYWSI